MYTIVGGLGQQGKAIVQYLLACTNDKIVTIDPRPRPTWPSIARYNPTTRWQHIEKKLAYEDVPNSTKVLISCLPTHLNQYVVPAALRVKAHYLDLGGDTKITRNLHAAFRARALREETLILCDCGVAPGLASTIAGHLARASDAVSLRFFCGGLDKYPVPPLSYSITFGAQGVIKECTGIAEMRRNGKFILKPALSERELISVHGYGVLEADLVSGALSTSPAILSELRTLDYKFLRYPGHIDLLKEHILHAQDPSSMLSSLTKPVSPNNPDTLLLIAVIQNNRGVRDTYAWQWSYNKTDELSAMAQSTGFVVAATATMLADGVATIKSVPKLGIAHMHDVDYLELKKRVCKMPGQFVELSQDAVRLGA